jgi:hypothetical protein
VGCMRCIVLGSVWIMVSRRYRSSAACWSMKATIIALLMSTVIRINLLLTWLMILALRNAFSEIEIVDDVEMD